jgi:mono/diheme cytochrome c family protein
VGRISSAVASYLIVLSLSTAVPQRHWFQFALHRLEAAQTKGAQDPPSAKGAASGQKDRKSTTPAPRFGVVEYPPRPPADPTAVERGRSLYRVNCTFCHGADARGGDGGGPNLIRSTVVLDDQHGELLAPLLSTGRGAMPAFTFGSDQVSDLADFLHGFPVISQSRPTTLDIVVGSPSRGEAFVAAKCTGCHATDALRTFSLGIDDTLVLQQMWLMPGSGGRGVAPPIPAPPISATVTLPTGERVQGRLERLDDFSVSLTQADGRRRTFRTVGTETKVEVRNPLQPHIELLPTYTDADIHDVTAYLVSLKARP